METRRPHVRTIPLSCAPSQAPCPQCGKRARRKQILRRQVRTIAYKEIVFLEITYGENRARCGCCTTFRTGVEPKALDDNKVREAIVDRILDDGRTFVDRLTLLFEEDQTEKLAWARHAALSAHPRFQKIPELSAALKTLPAEKFAKMIAFLKSPACRQVRTNNHVERVNRQLRHQEKARDKWRKRRTIVRFMVLLLDRRYKRERAMRNRWDEDSEPIVDNGRSPKAVPRGRVA
jgi:hypothetical protein